MFESSFLFVSLALSFVKSFKSFKSFLNCNRMHLCSNVLFLSTNAGKSPTFPLNYFYRFLWPFVFLISFFFGTALETITLIKLIQHNFTHRMWSVLFFYLCLTFFWFCLFFLCSTKNFLFCPTNVSFFFLRERNCTVQKLVFFSKKL